LTWCPRRSNSNAVSPFSSQTTSLTVDQTGFDIEPLERLDHGREALAPVGAAAGEEADVIAGAQRHHPVTVVLDLMTPAEAKGRFGPARGLQGTMKPCGRSIALEADRGCDNTLHTIIHRAAPSWAALVL
jgi:hypothetical protein